MGNLFHHDLAWEENEFELMQEQATSLVKSNEDLGLFFLSIAKNLSLDLLNDIIEDSRGEVKMQLNSLVAADGSLDSMPKPDYVEIDSSKGVRGSWNSIGVTYGSKLILQSGMFSTTFNNFNGLNGEGSLILNGRESLMGFTAVVDGEEIINDLQLSNVILSMSLEDGSYLVRF